MVFSQSQMSSRGPWDFLLFTLSFTLPGCVALEVCCCLFFTTWSFPAGQLNLYFLTFYNAWLIQFFKMLMNQPIVLILLSTYWMLIMYKVYVSTVYVVPRMTRMITLWNRLYTFYTSNCWAQKLMIMSMSSWSNFILIHKQQELPV
jgi:hypothetical protein